MRIKKYFLRDNKLKIVNREYTKEDIEAHYRKMSLATYDNLLLVYRGIIELGSYKGTSIFSARAQ